MFLTRMGDMAAILQGGWPVYQYHKTRLMSEGVPQAKAQAQAIEIFEMATVRAQQDGRLSSLSTYQRANSFTKLFTVYKTAPASYMRLEMAAIRNFARGRITPAEFAKQFTIFHFVLPNLFQLASNAFLFPFMVDDEDRAWELARRQARASVVGSMNGILIWGDMIQALADGLSGAPRFLVGTSLPLLDQTNKILNGAVNAFDAVKDIWTTDEIESEDFEKVIRGSLPVFEVATGIPATTLAEIWNGVGLIADGDEEEAFWRMMGFSPYSRAEGARQTRRDPRATRVP